MEENKEINEGLSPLSALLSSPEIMEKFTSVISQLKNGGDFANPPPSNNNSTATNDNSTTEEHNFSNISAESPTFDTIDPSSILANIPKVLSLLSDDKHSSSFLDPNQKALLNALRPYLSEKRRELIDLFIKMDRFGSIFKAISKE
jgi:hypothetical protein